MKRYLILLSFAVTTVGFAASFTALAPDEGYGVGSTAWRFASGLSKDSVGVIEVCFVEDGSPARILGIVEVRPFRSSEEKMPDLRILFARAEVDGKERVLVLVSYGLRSGTFIAEVPGLTTRSLSVSGKPQANAQGEFTLLGYGGGPVTFKPDGSIMGLRGRLFFRYVDKG